MKKKALKFIIPAVIIVVAGIVLFLYFGKGKKAGNNSQSNGRERFSATSFSGSLITADMITASGVTNVGTVSETFDVTELDTELRIEAVYVASGDAVKAGEKVLKLTEESVKAAREELEDKVLDAELAYRAGAIEYERSKIVAEYDRDSAKLSGEQAEAVYQDSMKDATQDVDSAQSKLNQTKEEISEYGSYVDGGTYSEYFKVDEYQKLYDENLKLLTDNMEKWGITWPQVTGQGGSGMMGGAAPGTQGGSDASEYSQWVSVLKSLYSVLEQNAKDLEKAKQSYDDAVTTASLEKKLLELSLPELEENLAQAKASYEKAILQYQVTKEKSLSEAEKADHEYETALEKAESDYNDLKSAWEDAKENLEIFEKQVGDGYFYASADGNILRTSVRAENTLRANSTIFTYSDTSAMTVTVSVDQSDIARITPGENAVVTSQRGALVDGIVKSVNPVATSEGRNNVTYSVTLLLDGAGTLGSNESVTVIFGTTAKELNGGSESASPKNSERDGQESRPERPEGSMPSGFPGGWSGEMPEGMPEDWSGEMPEGMPGNWSSEMPEGMPGNWSGEKPEGRSGQRNGKDAEE